ncbi:MAG: ATP-binding cassette domain-containing protein [Bacteroidales bacterium]|jgi:ABC-2 type transport system ATP-binding protein|nr:ATP-binding cassette domain-containing protein [Bacteroidales bacterium]
MNILSAHQIDKQYGTVKVLDQLTVDVPLGSIYGLLGPNGAGKTTFIRIANRITAPDRGELFFMGHKMRYSDTAKIGYLPEERGLYRKMKTGEQALYLAGLKGLSKTDARKRTAEWFERFEITGWWNKKVEELSKGMQQKLQFIITVLHDPSLLILDEPFSGFDPVNAELMKKEIRRLRDKGTTVILSTHNMSSVEEMCDHISLIDNSRCILHGNVSQIRQAYKSGEYELGFEGDAKLLEEVLDAYQCSVDWDAEHPGKARICAPEKAANKLLSIIISCVSVTSFNEILPSMHDIFIRNVKKTPRL